MLRIGKMSKTLILKNNTITTMKIKMKFQKYVRNNLYIMIMRLMDGRFI